MRGFFSSQELLGDGSVSPFPCSTTSPCTYIHRCHTGWPVQFIESLLSKNSGFGITGQLRLADCPVNPEIVSNCERRFSRGKDSWYEDGPTDRLINEKCGIVSMS